MKKNNLLFLSVFSSLLLAFGWPEIGFSFLLFIALIPLLILENEIFEKKLPSFSLFKYSYLSFLIWNSITTWWTCNASVGGGLMAIFANSFLMTITFQMFHVVRKKVNTKATYFIFIVFWITFEFLHHDWDLTWTWLTLGNGLASYPSIIQWYEYTGIFGGSLWILLVNVLVYKIILDYNSKIKNYRLIIGVIMLLILPILFSIYIRETCSIVTQSDPETKNIVVVQPNIDPYNEKFNSSFQLQLQKMLELAKSKIDSTIDYLIFPETALTENIWENEFQKSYSINALQEFLQQYPKLKIIIGASTLRQYMEGEKISVTARKFTEDDAYYDAYNTALQVESGNKIQVYHKSKLVPGVERMPFPALFKPLEKLAVNLGGTTGSLGMQEDRTVFNSAEENKVAPIICYESVYGEYVSEYVKNGANFLAIITNDGWWGDTPGYKQHLIYGALRAIETRRWVARSANTGISCFINPLGEIVQATTWWTSDIIKQNITLNSEQTFYTKYGDYVARIAFYGSLLILIYYFLLRFRILKK